MDSPHGVPDVAAAPAPNGAGNGQVDVDDVDLRILEELATDARLPVAELARRVGVSRANAYKRLDRLQQTGVIRGFAAQIDHDKLGLDVTAFIAFRVDQSTPGWQHVRDKLAEFGEIQYCALVAGEFDGVALVRFPDVRTLRQMVLERLQAMPEVQLTRTFMVLEELVCHEFVAPSPTQD